MARLRVLADGVCAQNLGILNSSQIRGIQQKKCAWNWQILKKSEHSYSRDHRSWLMHINVLHTVIAQEIITLVSKCHKIHSLHSLKKKKRKGFSSQKLQTMHITYLQQCSGNHYRKMIACNNQKRGEISVQVIIASIDFHIPLLCFLQTSFVLKPIDACKTKQKTAVESEAWIK